MVIAALLSFGILLMAWALAPEGRAVPGSQAADRPADRPELEAGGVAA